MTEIRKLIPNHCFEKNAFQSLGYMCRDLLILSTSFYVWPWIETTFSKWSIAYWLLWIAFTNIYGFFMWCLFVVGHDCGHGSFSEYPLLNAVCGHLCHTPIAVPFYAWAYSHKQHHKYHNHHEKDLSHSWFTAEEWASDTAYPSLRQSRVFLLIQPFIGYFYYLYLGIPDGSHVWPLSKLYQREEKTEIRRKHEIESAISTTSLVLFFAVFGNAIGAYYFLVAYVPCWLMFSFWLFMVTYMQHHNEVSKHGSIIYDDKDFNFLQAALQTIDRKFGKLFGVSLFDIDVLHHNITDGHVVHHIYFTKIPHYHLADATNAVAPYLRQRGVYNFTDLSQKLIFSYFINMFLQTHFVGTFLRKDNKYKISSKRDMSEE